MILLLILSLILTGCEAERDIKACPGGWFEFICKYYNQNVPTIKALNKNLHSTVADRWMKEDENIYMYHNQSCKFLRVIVKNLKNADSGDFKCENTQGSKTKLKLKVKNADCCKTQLLQTAYATAKTTITCIYDKKYREGYLCRENDFDCMEIFSKRSGTSNGRFTLTEIERGFNVSISNVSSQDSGVYWCGVKSDDYKRSMRQIQLEVQNITSDTRSATVGETFIYNCDYRKFNFIKKFFCKGEDPSLCQRLVSSTKPGFERFSLKVDKFKLNISITMKNLSPDDSGTYWCGAEDQDRSDLFVCRLVMTVEPRLATIPPVHETTRSLTSDKLTTASAKHQDGSLLPVIGAIVAVICAAVLVLLVVICRRCDSSKNTSHGGSQNEDHNYAEIEERPQKPDLGTAPKTVYVTANFPSKVSASHYSNFLFEKSPVEVRSDTNCTVGGSVEDPTYSTVNHPSCFTEKPPR